MWGCVLTLASGCFILNHGSETNTSQEKADYTVVSTIFHYVWIFVEYQYIVVYDKFKKLWTFMQGRRDTVS
jgi:hypothetical protein